VTRMYSHAWPLFGCVPVGAAIVATPVAQATASKQPHHYLTKQDDPGELV